MKTLTELYKDADTFLMLYGSTFMYPNAESLKRAARKNQLQEQLRNASVNALRNTQVFLRDYYGNVAGTNLTGADGLDMDEAHAAQLYRDIDAALAAA